MAESQLAARGGIFLVPFATPRSAPEQVCAREGTPGRTNSRDARSAGPGFAGCPQLAVE